MSPTIAAAVALLIVIPQPLANLNRPHMCAVEDAIEAVTEPASHPRIWAATSNEERTP